ncbi:MAG: phosphoribosyltransferase family protein [Pseudomonadota bacterium]
MNGFGLFSDRANAGGRLAAAVKAKAYADPVVLALPRGGVPVALEVALAIDAPLDLVLVRKIGVDFQPELAAAAVVDGDQPEIVINDDVVKAARVSQTYLDNQVQAKLAEIAERRQLYLKDRARAAIKGHTAIVVDDGIATGASIRAALHALRRKQPARLVLAVPVAPAETLAALQGEVDDIICLATPEPFYAIGAHYSDFRQVPDDEVVALLAAADAAGPGKLDIT